MNGLACGRRNVCAGAQLQGFYLNLGNRFAIGVGGIFTCLPLPFTVTECDTKTSLREEESTEDTRKSRFAISHQMEFTTQRILPHPNPSLAHPEGQSSLGWVSHKFVCFVLKMSMGIKTHWLCIKNVIKNVSPFVIS